MTDCRDFRDRLQAWLGERPADAGAGPLAWHEHLLGCDACRALLEAEEALELLLDSLPEPKLPPELAGRVLARLEAGRDRAERALDALLDLDRDGERAVEAPPELAGDVLAALGPHRRKAAARRREAALDRLLDQDAVAVPADLSERVLAGLEAHRERRAPRRLQEVEGEPAFGSVGRWNRGLVALAAALLAVLGVIWMLQPRGVQPPLDSGGELVANTEPDEPEPTAGPADPAPTPEAQPQVAEATPPESAPAATPADPEPVPDELLASLDLLESWDVLASDDLELALADLDEFDLLVLDLESEGI